MKFVNKGMIRLIINRKIYYSIFLSISFHFLSYSQIGINTIEPDPSSVLDIRSREDYPGGVLFPRVQLEKATDKAPFNIEPEEGLVVYNISSKGEVGTIDFVSYGLNYWDGSKWVSFLGQYDWLKQGTRDIQANLHDDQYTQGYLGIGDFSKKKIKAPLHVLSNDIEEPVIFEGLKSINDVEDSNEKYYDLKISETGVVKKSLSHNNFKNFYLYKDFEIVDEGGSDGSVKNNKNSFLLWDIEGNESDKIILPETGNYIFSFRLYGTLSGSKVTTNHYFLSLWKNNDLKPSDIVEIALVKVNSNQDFATYSVNMLISVRANDSVKIRLTTSSKDNFSWKLKGNKLKEEGNKTDLQYWKVY